MIYYDGAEMLAMRQCTRKDGKNKCLSQREVAERMGVHRNTIYKWEVGGAPKWAGLAYESLMSSLSADAVEQTRMLAAEAREFSGDLTELRKLHNRLTKFFAESQ